MIDDRMSAASGAGAAGLGGLFTPLEYAKAFDALQDGARLLKYCKGSSRAEVRVFNVRFHEEGGRPFGLRNPHGAMLSTLCWRRPGLRMMYQKAKALPMQSVLYLEGAESLGPHNAPPGVNTSDCSSMLCVHYYSDKTTLAVKRLRILFADRVQFELLSRCIVYSYVATRKKYSTFNGALARVLLSKDLGTLFREVNVSITLDKTLYPQFNVRKVAGGGARPGAIAKARAEAELGGSSGSGTLATAEPPGEESGGGVPASEAAGPARSRPSEGADLRVAPRGELQVSYKLQITSYKLQVTSCK